MQSAPLEWAPNVAFSSLKEGQASGTFPIYAELLGRGKVGLLDSGDGHRMFGLFDRESIQKAAIDTTLFSNVTVPPGTPRILPLMADPPEHTPYRRLFAECFKADEIVRTESSLRPLAAEWIDRLIANGSADFALEYAYPFSTHSLCVFLGVEDDWSIFNDWSKEMERLTGSGTRSTGDALPEEHFVKIIPYLGKLIGAAKANPGSDPVSRFIAARIDEQPLDEQVVVGLIIALILAGRSTTASGIGNTVLRLAQDPALQDFLRSNPDRIRDAIEESLRLDSPQQSMPRKATISTNVNGVDIPEGSPVFLNYGSANVDPAFWDRPDEFDIDRQSRPHFAFGRGVHQCPGAPLGRMEILLTVQELLARTRSFAVNGSIRRDTWPRLSVEQLPLTFIAA